MKAGMLILTVLLHAVAVSAQQSPAAPSVISTNSSRSSYSVDRLALPDSDNPPGQMDVLKGKHFQVSGPLVHVAKSKSIWAAPRRFLHLINPFAKREPQPRIERLPDVSPNAWTTTVGWHPTA